MGDRKKEMERERVNGREQVKTKKWETERGIGDRKREWERGRVNGRELVKTR